MQAGRVAWSAVAFALLGCCAAVAVVLVSGPAAATNATVTATTSNQWSPATVTVNVGDTVTWTNPTLTTHNVTSASGPWSKNTDLGPAVPTATSTSFRFTSSGSYGYYCRFHRAQGMVGTVVVRGATRPSPTPTRTRLRPSPSPTRTRRSPRPTPSRPGASASPSRSPSPAALPSRAATVSPSPRLAVVPPRGAVVDIGSGGLTAHPATGRERGVWVALAAVALGGVLTAQVRTVLAVPADPPPPD
ncbi:MAG: plastocyanin/azurin family copper-binding protein [Mycobacteriales bacterium]|nr:cupredoxin domain-containing protein [Frankia sp.]